MQNAELNSAFCFIRRRQTRRPYRPAKSALRQRGEHAVRHSYLRIFAEDGVSHRLYGRRHGDLGKPGVEERFVADGFHPALYRDGGEIVAYGEGVFPYLFDISRYRHRNEGSAVLVDVPVYFSGDPAG